MSVASYLILYYLKLGLLIRTVGYGNIFQLTDTRCFSPTCLFEVVCFLLFFQPFSRTLLLLLAFLFLWHLLLRLFAQSGLRIFTRKTYIVINHILCGCYLSVKSSWSAVNYSIFIFIDASIRFLCAQMYVCVCT